MINIFLKFKDLFLKGDERSVQTKKNVFLLFAIKILSLPISFILVPLTIGYVNSESYGIWLTISSMVAWMSFFDIGINNGLRNKLAESIAKGDLKLSKQYISTTYAILSIISITVLITFFFANYFINWSVALNTASSLSIELSKVALTVVGYFCLRFTLSTINIILLANQLPARASFQAFVEQLVSLIIIFMLTKHTEGSLLKLAYGLCIAPVLVLIYYNAKLFTGKLEHIRPSFKDVHFSLTRDLMGIGLKFFIIQIAGIIQFQTANFIIIQYFGPHDVTVYNIVFKYFSVLTMIMAIFMTPFWSAVTDAYVRKDYNWIRNAEIKYRNIAIILTLVGVLMLLFSNYAYDVWLGNIQIDIPLKISIYMFLFTIISFFGGIYCTILNGISELNVQYKVSLFSPFLFIFFSYIFITVFNWGLVSIIIASILSNFNGFLLAPLQYKRIFMKFEKSRE